MAMEGKIGAVQVRGQKPMQREIRSFGEIPNHCTTLEARRTRCNESCKLVGT